MHCTFGTAPAHLIATTRRRQKGTRFLRPGNCVSKFKSGGVLIAQPGRELSKKVEVKTRWASKYRLHSGAIHLPKADRKLDIGISTSEGEHLRSFLVHDPVRRVAKAVVILLAGIARPASRRVGERGCHITVSPPGNASFSAMLRRETIQKGP